MKRRDLFAHGRHAARALVLAGALTGAQAQAIDLFDPPPKTLDPSHKNTHVLVDCYANGAPGTVGGQPSVVNCASDDWVTQCGLQWGTIDPTDFVNNVCNVVNPDTGKSFAQQAAEAGQSNTLATSESVFVPYNSLVQFATVPDAGSPLPIGEQFAPSVASPARAAMESIYGKVSLESSNSAAVTSWANQELLAQYRAWNTPNLDPLTYRRLNNTTEGSDQMLTCEDYTYRSFQDVEVWLDGINACGSQKQASARRTARGLAPGQVDQARCIVNTTLNNYSSNGVGTPPAIFRRRPQNSAHAYVYDPGLPDNHINELIDAGVIDPISADPFSDQWQLTELPKNAFYAGTEHLITKTIFAALADAGVDAQGFVNELNHGDGLYETGTGVPVARGAFYTTTDGRVHQGFYDEWDFHNYMNQATQATTEGQSREYRRRTEDLTAAYNQMASDMTCLWSNALTPGGCSSNLIPNAVGKVNPGDTQIFESDPFQMNAIFSQIAPSQLAVPPALNGMTGFGANLQTAQFTFAQLQAGAISSGSQNVAVTGHVPGALSPSAAVSSILLSQLSPTLLSRASPAQLERIEVADARLSDMLGAQTLMILNNLGNIGFGFGGLVGRVLAGGISPVATTPISGVTPSAPATNAVPFSYTQTINPDSTSVSDPGDLSTYTQTYAPLDGSGYGHETEGVIESAWLNNPPRFVFDPQSGQPVLNCEAPSRRGVFEGGDSATPSGTSRSTDPSNPIGMCGPTYIGDSGLRVDCLYHTEKTWVSLCRMTNLLLKEWNRAKANQPSCLDRNTVVCDWKPQDFVDRFVTQQVGYASAAKEVEYNYCKRWTSNGSFLDSTKKGGVLTIGFTEHQRKSLDGIRGVLDAREVAFEKLMKNVPVKAQDTLGKLKTDGNAVGSKSFGGGFNYALGWQTHLTRWNGNKNGVICKLGGNVDASFTAQATLFGDSIQIIDANVHVDTNDVADPKQGNPDGDDVNNAATYWSSLYIAKFKVYNSGKKTLAFNGATSPNASLNEPLAADDGKPEFVEAPFQVGWITVTVSAGIEYDYGASLTLNVTAPTKGACTSKIPTAFAMSAEFRPYADLGVWVDADVSLAGIAGVGVEVDLTLVGLALPLSLNVALAGNKKTIDVSASLDMTLTTLKGELDFYIIALWVHVASFKIVSWQGFTAKFPIFHTPPVSIDIDLLNNGPVYPPGQVDPSETI